MNQKIRAHQTSEQIIRDEKETLNNWWSHGPFEFLLQRVQDRYHRKGISDRRKEAEQVLNRYFPMLTDDMLLSLLNQATTEYLIKCQTRFTFTGFQRTPAERVFAATLLKVLESLPSAKHIEVYPSFDRSNFLKADRKAVVGTHIPDFLLFGVKAKGYSAIAIEIDGDSHVKKYGKDAAYYDHMKELGILVLPIPNEKANDIEFVRSVLLHYRRRRSGSLDLQIRANKRKIWTKTIVNHLTFKEIENHVSQKFGVELHLAQEAELLLQNAKCPRVIRDELKRIHTHLQ